MEERPAVQGTGDDAEATASDERGEGAAEPPDVEPTDLREAGERAERGKYVPI